MDKFLYTYILLKLIRWDAENLSQAVPSNEIESVIKSFLSKKSQGPDSFTASTSKYLKN
jgi:hypothetical protein